MLMIPFQDTRYDGNRRWSDMLKWKQLRVDEINDLINRCEVLNRKDLMVLRTAINHRLKNLQSTDWFSLQKSGLHNVFILHTNLGGGNHDNDLHIHQDRSVVLANMRVLWPSYQAFGRSAGPGSFLGSEIVATSRLSMHELRSGDLQKVPGKRCHVRLQKQRMGSNAVSGSLSSQIDLTASM